MGTRRRSRSNDGFSGAVTKGLPIDAGLMASLAAGFYRPPPERSQPRLFHGPRQATNTKPSPVSDEQVLDIRRMHEWRGMPVAQIAAETGLTPGYVRGVLLYLCRGHLDPGPRPPQL